MRWTVSNQHFDFFLQNRFIEFEGLLNEKQIEELTSLCERGLCKRLHCAKESLMKKSPDAIYLKGHDLFRESAELQKLECLPKLAAIAAELTRETHLRLGYDQILKSTTKEISSSETAFLKWFSKPPSIEQISSLQGVICGLLICLNDETCEPQEEKTIEIKCPLPRKAGSATFIHPSLALPINQLYTSNQAIYLLITYIGPRAVYIHQENDPHTHHLKALGYGFGDKLQEKHFPTVKIG